MEKRRTFLKLTALSPFVGLFVKGEKQPKAKTTRSKS